MIRIWNVLRDAFCDCALFFINACEKCADDLRPLFTRLVTVPLVLYKWLIRMTHGVFSWGYTVCCNLLKRIVKAIHTLCVYITYAVRRRAARVLNGVATLFSNTANWVDAP
jgi:hypothetical protein